jgi:hypothetical protein
MKPLAVEWVLFEYSAEGKQIPMADSESRDFSYEQFVEAVEAGLVQTVRVFERPSPLDATQAIVQTTDGNSKRVMIPANSDWVALLQQYSVEFSTVEEQLASMGIGPDFLYKMILKAFLPGLAIFIGIDILLDVLDVKSWPIRLVAYIGIFNLLNFLGRIILKLKSRNSPQV